MESATMTAMQPSIKTGIYKNSEHTLLVTAIATHEVTGERMVVYQDDKNNVFACGEEDFKSKGLKMISKVNAGRLTVNDLISSKPAKKSLSWLWKNE